MSNPSSPSNSVGSSSGSHRPNAIAWMDMTIHLPTWTVEEAEKCNAETAEVAELIKILTEMCKMWVFQIEEGDKGGVHIQGRINLVKKRRCDEVRSWCCNQTQESKLFEKSYLRPTTKAIAETKDMFYVMKSDTKRAGPWTNEKPKGANYIPSRFDCVHNPLTRFTYQKRIIYNLDQKPDVRNVCVLYDPAGTAGKSTLYGYMMCRWPSEVTMVPVSTNNTSALTQHVQNFAHRKMYIFDVARSVEHYKHPELWTAVEEIKNGIVTDMRYKSTVTVMESMWIWVFVNTMANINALSYNRWEIFKLVKTGKIVNNAPDLDLKLMTMEECETIFKNEEKERYMNNGVNVPPKGKPSKATWLKSMDEIDQMTR